MSLSLLAVVFLALGVLVFIGAVKRLRHRRLGSATLRSGLSISLLGIGAMLGAFGINLYTYDRLTYQAVVADLYIANVSENQYRVELRITGKDSRSFDLTGDEWRLEVRTIKWKPSANLLGFNSKYRLDRFGNRYLQASDEQTKKRNAYELFDKKTLELDYANVLKNYSPWHDVTVGQGVHHPLADKAHYQIKITQSGLISYPMNEAAQRAVSEWK